MKKLKYISIITFSLCWLCCSGLNNSREIEQPFLKIEVELLTNLDTISLPAYCGNMIWDMTFEYRIIKVIEGDYNESSIRINHICPREAVESKQIENIKIYTYAVKKRFGIKSIAVGEKREKEELNDYEIIE